LKTETTTINSPKGIQILQIVLGAIAIALSLAVIVNPGVGIATLTFLLSITLLVVGIERLVTGLTLSKHSKSSRFGNIGLGALAALLGIAVMAFPLFTTGVLVTLLALGLLFTGIARVIHGISDKNTSKWSKGFLVGVGVLSLAVSFMVFASPALGVFLLTLVLGINLLIIGIQSVAYGISGHQRRRYNPTTATTTNVEHGR
jgi:uncharacterized membrane protein HdeD (DUF308 family)